ncbi:MAG TPA: lysylphosphatidylglycerol synthase transmembrane domain-containing protein [candidate division Zixibacteria bacterium]|nr:lysylphosphatidylglycerol synthase transmembrane domain-containing protein [candidate division Zixibacteria bacterium]
MTMNAKKLLYVLLGVIISGLLIWMLFRNINFHELWLALKQADYWWLIPNIAFIVLTMYQRAYRWKFMVAPIKEVKFSKLLAATCVGFMANNVLPLRLGEFARAYSLSSQDKDISKSASLATIFVERMVFDLVALLVIFAAILTFATSVRHHIDSEMIAATKVAVAIAILGIGFIVVLATRPSQVGSLLTRYLFFLPERIKTTIQTIVLKFSRGLEFLKSFRLTGWVAVQTFLIWVFMGISNYFVFKAFNFDIPIDASFVLLVVVSILILTPSTPGFLGVYHYGVVLSLGLYGIGGESALSCAIVLHATQYIVVTAMGFYFLKKEHLSLKQLEHGMDEEIEVLEP